MKYEGLKKLETTVTELSTVVYSCRGGNGANTSARPHMDYGMRDVPQYDTPAAVKKRTVKKSADKKASVENSAAEPATEMPAAEKPKKKRRIIFSLLKQTAICAFVVGALLLLKYIDSGFSAEVFKGVKDIISYSYEIPGIVS